MLRGKLRITLTVLLALAVLGMGVALALRYASTDGERKLHEPIPPSPSYQFLEQTAKAFPGFGGFYLDDEDKALVYVYMMDPSQQEDAEQAAKVVVDWFYPGSFIREVRPLQADYTMADLVAWRTLVDTRIWVALDAVRGSHIITKSNRLEIGVSTRASAAEKAELERLLAEFGIPRGAVVFREESPVELLARPNEQNRQTSSVAPPRVSPLSYG